MHTYHRSNLILLSFTLSCAWLARADFEPIVLTGDSYNQDVVVEKAAPPAVVPVTSASMEAGIANTGFTWFERGYIPEWPATGIPEAGSLLTSDQLADHQYQMPLSYKTSNAVLIDAARASALLTFTAPTNYVALSFLTSSGGARDLIRYTVHYLDQVSESGTFISPHWYSDGDPAWAGNGCVNVTSFIHADLNSYNPRLYSVDIGLSNSVSPVSSIDLSLASGAGHTAILAVSGALVSGDGFVPIDINGYNEDLIVEANAIKPGFLDTNTTATMDNGTANTRFTWYERGYYPLAPETGLPEAGSSLASETDPGHRFLMPPSYTDTNAILIDAVDTRSVLSLVMPACYSALSFLTASGHGPVTNQCVINHSDGNSETNSFISPDWLDNAAGAFTARGRVSVSTKISDRVNAEAPRLYAVDVPVVDTGSSVTNIVLSLAGAGTDAHAVVFAVSGAAATTAPPTRPVLSISYDPRGALTIHSSQPGRLQSCTSLPGQVGIWEDDGPIVQTLTFTPSPAEPVRFYRVSAQ